jgi:SNF2 family DNA or RNA helicase
MELCGEHGITRGGMVPNFEPAVGEWGLDCAYRIGQTRNLMVHWLISRGTFEEKINEMLKDKRELAELTAATGEKWIGDYSNSDPKKIFTLR